MARTNAKRSRAYGLVAAALALSAMGSPTEAGASPMPGFMGRPRTPPAPGAVWASEDGRLSYSMGGFVHLQSITTLSLDAGEADRARAETAPALRRARATAEATAFGILDARLLFDFAMDVIPLDAYVDLRAHHAANLRFGKFKSPFGFERLAPIYAVRFTERAYPTQLAPNRDFGLFLHGRTASRTVGYELAALGGADDLEIAHFYDGPPHFAGRVYFMPFQAAGPAPLAELGLGASTTVGRDEDTEQLGVRWSLHAHYSYRRLAAWFEYVETRRGDPLTERSANRAWMLQSSLTLTDDDNGYFGLDPQRPLGLGAEGIGALAVAVRVHELRLGDVAPASEPRNHPGLTARAAGAALLWTLNRHFEGRFDVEVSRWNRPGSPATVTGDELAIRGRIEARF